MNLKRCFQQSSAKVNLGGCSPQKIPKNPKKSQKNPIPIYRFWCSDWDFLGFFGFFWDFLGFFGIFWVFWDFLGFFGIFWDFLGSVLGFLRFFWLEVSDGLKFGKQLFVGNPCIQ